MWGNQMSGMGGFDPMMLQRLLGQGGGIGNPSTMVSQGMGARPGGYSGLGGGGGGGLPQGMFGGMPQGGALGNLGRGMAPMASPTFTGGGNLGPSLGPANPGGFGQFASASSMADPRNRRAKEY